MTDKTFCAYMGCFIKKCEQSLSWEQNKEKNEYVSVCKFAPTCRKPLTYVLEELNNDR